jgi:hypothetical protein
VSKPDFRALVLREVGEGTVEARIETLPETALPEGDVTVAIEHSTLNYKDGMILQGLGRLVRRYPHIPGIDFAGKVERSDSPSFRPGDKVILTGWRVALGRLRAKGSCQSRMIRGQAHITPAQLQAAGEMFGELMEDQNRRNLVDGFPLISVLDNHHLDSQGQPATVGANATWKPPDLPEAAQATPLRSRTTTPAPLAAR